jgi:hypothetical protein
MLPEATDKLHGAEPFLKSRQLRSYTRISPNILWNPKVHYGVNKSLPSVRFVSQISTVHTIPSYLSDFLHSTCQISYPFSLAYIVYRKNLSLRPFVTFRNKIIFLQWGVGSSTPNPQAGGPLLVGSPRLLMQYIYIYPPYLEAVSSIRNLRTRHAVVTRDPLNMVQRPHTWSMMSPFKPRYYSVVELSQLCTGLHKMNSLS